MADWRRAFSQAFDTGGRAFGNAYADIAAEKARKAEEAKENKRRAQDDYDRSGRWDAEYLGEPPKEQERTLDLSHLGGAAAMFGPTKWTEKNFEERAGGAVDGHKQYQDIRKTDQYRERVAANKAATARLSALTNAFGVAPEDTYKAMESSSSMDAGDIERTTISAVQAQEERRRRVAEEKAARDKVIAERVAMYGKNARFLAEAKRVGVDPNKAFADDDAYSAILNATFAKDPKGERAPSGLEVMTDRMKRLESVGQYLWTQARGNPEEAYQYGLRGGLSSQDALEAVNLARAQAEQEREPLGASGRPFGLFGTRLPRQGVSPDERRDWAARSGVAETLSTTTRRPVTGAPNPLLEPGGR